MRNTLSSNKFNITNNQKVIDYLNLGNRSDEGEKKRVVSRTLMAEVGETFYRYIDQAGLAYDHEIIVLSSRNHYYYDAEEMENIKSIINLKELNQIRDVKRFMRSIYQLLSERTNFFGCFVDYRKMSFFDSTNNSSPLNGKNEHDDLEENGIVSNIPFINLIYNFIDSKTNKYMTARSVSELLGNSGFVVLDMKEIKGITYFHSQKK